ncbi:hypothetical protein BP6252_01791 [Coleophoma cylindrospora]|uniref:Transcription factor domain-containing protein n=1 Tax=Coleophoma cylindrospora TaxID=1849047 RepID=A0A3D8STX9_9HELO|nr:hypothetical protein BP6252_01791 [Coleophoma cylindrospora]
MGALMPSDDAMHFIVTTPITQSVEEKRKLIRSQVMRGKNRKRLLSRPPSWINGGAVNGPQVFHKGNAISIPAKIGGEFSFTTVSAEMSSDTLDTILKFKRAMFPLELSLTSDETEASWFEPIWSDAACFHFTVFIAKEYLAFIHGQTENSQTAQTHFIKALAILQRRLACSNTELSTSDSTILVVVGLTMAATALDDLEMAVKHLKGLHKLVTLRGGISAFKENKHLQTKICRVDLGVALSIGCQALFLSDGISWDSYISSRAKMPTSGLHDSDPWHQTLTSDLGCILNNLDTRLSHVWDDLSEFVRAANVITQGKLNMDNELYQEVMVSIHYRLVNLRFDVGTVNETIRLALLAFSSTIFLQWRGLKTRYKYLAQHFKTALSPLNHKTGVVPEKLTLWLYIIGAISIFDEHEQTWLQPLLTEVLQIMNMTSWNEVRLSLKSVLWVNVLHDPFAKKLIETTLNQI